MTPGLTHLAQRRRVLRSKTAELVRQEFYGWVLAHYAVRWLMHQAAQRHRLEHAQLSFASHVQLFKRSQPRSGAFPPERPRRRKRWWDELLVAAASLRATRTLGQRTPRMIKRRNSPYASFDRRAARRVPTNSEPSMLPPRPLHRRQRFPQSKTN